MGSERKQFSSPFFLFWQLPLCVSFRIAKHDIATEEIKWPTASAESALYTHELSSTMYRLYGFDDVSWSPWSSFLVLKIELIGPPSKCVRIRWGDVHCTLRLNTLVGIRKACKNYDLLLSQSCYFMTQGVASLGGALSNSVCNSVFSRTILSEQRKWAVMAEFQTKQKISTHWGPFENGYLKLSSLSITL